MPTILQNHYVLAVHDLRTSSEFFDRLGFKIISKPNGWIFVQRDNCMILLGSCPDAIHPSRLGDHSYIGYLRVDDVDGLYKDLQRRRVNVLSSIETKPWEMREFSVVSPEGHRMTIGQWVGENP